MLHVAPQTGRKTLRSFPPRLLSVSRWLGWFFGGVVRGGDLKVFVGLDAKDDVLVGAAARLLSQEQT